MKDIGIIGAGPGGLAAGMLLAAKGFNVEIFEARDKVGGRNGWIEEEGFIFDIGPTFLMMSFILEEIFAETGHDLHDYVDLKLMDPFYQLIFADGKKLKPSIDPEDFKNSIENINPGDARGYDNYMKDNAKKMRYTLPVLQRPYTSIFDIINFDIIKLLTVLNPQRSLWDELGRFFSDDRVKVGFTFQSKYLGMSPFNCPSMFSILPFIEYRWGVYHVIGGLNQLAQAMARVFTELGGTINLNSEVAEVKLTGKSATGLRLTDGQEKSFAEIIMNSDFAWSMKNLFPPKSRKKYTDENLDSKNYSCSTFMLYLGLDDEYNELEHNNVFIAKDYEKNFLEIESEKKLSQDPSFYVQNASITDPEVAPEGKTALYILVPVANLKATINWQEEKDKFRDLILDKLAEKLDDDNIRNKIIFEKVITPLDWRDDMRVGYGATFNLGHNLNQMLVFRPRNKFEEFNNMWLVGGGTNPGSGLPTIYESGRIAANLIQKKYGLEYTFNRKNDLEQIFQRQDLQPDS